ncbi:hypothetical protein F383_13309 [Gossypium arboreum]|uniref:Uncharacterized protein n=1 Tax=Gossypium arboreum TaxID=29729 RepID=A0A0B0MHC4_GOSAR|nr:hypothetical protein F383_37503 [Gossypium arboreum]KHG27462.1 hypothetical protein F383_13309 [Gossypium arboreum]
MRSIEFTNFKEKSSIKCAKHGIEICMNYGLSQTIINMSHLSWPYTIA